MPAPHPLGLRLWRQCRFWPLSQFGLGALRVQKGARSMVESLIYFGIFRSKTGLNCCVGRLEMWALHDTIVEQ